MRIRGILEIELKSDLCVSSGYAYEGIVDTDVCYNKNGIPYIPGRRIKGCLRECAELVCKDFILDIFGRGGDDTVKGMIVGNAYPCDFQAIDAELTKLYKLDHDYKKVITPQKVLELFTKIKSQTSLDEETGVAVDTTLRYMRIVNQSSFLNRKAMKFCADIEYEESNKEQIKDIVKALRHIGMSRNRGLGNVRCRVLDEEVVEQKVVNKISEPMVDTDMVKMEYELINVQPLLISNENDDKSENYINGQSILGAFATAYLKSQYKNDEGLFKEIFLDGNVLFSNAYVSDEEGYEYIPTPLYINKLKKTKQIVNVLASDNVDVESITANGNIPKKINDRFMSISGGEVKFIEPQFDLLFHHTQSGAYGSDKYERNDSGILYSLIALSENQVFKGNIVGCKKYIDELKTLMDLSVFRFGKSRTAQYGECRFLNCKISKCENLQMNVKKGGKIVVTLVSDGVFSNEYGYTVRYDEVMEIIAKKFGIEYDSLESEAYIKTKVITGYNSKWNMKKQSIPAIMAGSAFVYNVTGDAEYKGEALVGEKNHEGFGKVIFANVEDMKFNLEEVEKISQEEINIDVLKPVLTRVLTNDFMDALKNNSDEIKLKLNASTIGRVTLMLMESRNAHDDFYKRVSSIKRTSEREQIMEFLHKYVFDSNNIPDVEKMIGTNKEAKRIYKLLCEVDKDYSEKIAKKIWKDYVQHILINQKYRVSEEGM